MDDNHLLNLNPYKTLRCLDGILSDHELSKIRKALQENVKQLFRLSEGHLRFAATVSGRVSWRQRVSRAYYSCYCASRAVRLAKNGFYDTDPSDHKRIGNLPDDFPSKAIWEDLLTKFRADRNLADYDHTVGESALELKSLEYLDKAERFLRESRSYLRGRGLI